MLLAGLSVLALATLAAFVIDARRHAVPWRRVVVAALDVVAGFAAAALAIAHLVAVVAVAMDRQPFVWDFRFASLLLVGVAIAAPGLECLLVARWLARGSAGAWRHAVVGSIGLIAVNATLLPIQGFAVLLAGLAAANLAVLLVARRVFTER